MGEIERLQAVYCDETDREHRRMAGQFFTPRWIAEGMADWVLACKPSAIVDPACGFGVLLDACRRRGYRGQLIGYEIDEGLVRRGREGYLGKPVIDIRCADFLATPKDAIPAAIVNPPYNRFQRRELPADIRLELAREAGLLVSGYTNQYALFLYLVLTRLRSGGRAAFIVPSEFLATGYGVQVKKFLATNRRLRHLILFDTEDRVFPEAATTACVLLFEGEPTDALEVWHLSGVGDAPVYAELCGERSLRQADARIPYDQLDVESNWQGLGCVDFDLKGFVALSEFGDVKRGIATGANEFFVLKPSEALKNGLTSTDLQPCIANASSVPDIMFAEGDWESLRRQDRPCYLFNGMGGQGTAAMRYVAYGEEQGYHRRYLTKMRKPWYKLELRQPAPLLLAVFGRGGFRVSLNRSSAVNLTAFHGFYPKESARFLLPLIWLYFQTATARDAFAIQQRAYGDGLKKLEPGDWSKLLVPDWRYWDENDLCIAIQWAQEALAEFDEGRGDRVDRWAMRLNELIRQRRWRSTETRHADPQIVLS